MVNKSSVLGTGDWNEWSRHVLHQLEELNGNYKELAKEVGELRTEMRTEIGMLKVKASVWGALAGTFPALALLIAKVVAKLNA